MVWGKPEMQSSMGNPKPWWSQDTVAVVTGGNKGLGYAIVKGLAMQGLTVILTARDQSRGLEAVESLERQLGLSVHFHRLDVTSSTSMDTFVDFLRSNFGSIDILVNNAGLAGLPPDQGFTKLEAAKLVLETNYYGVQSVTQKLLPLLRPSAEGARIVNISSGSSRLDNLKNESLREQLSNIEELTQKILEEIVQIYLQDVQDEKLAERGWSGFFGNYNYGTSKTFLNAYSRLLARDLAADSTKKVFVNCMCPGLTSTDMTMKSGHAPELGADTAVWLSLIPAAEASSGKFFMKRGEVGFTQIPFYMNDKFVFPPDQFEALTMEAFQS